MYRFAILAVALVLGVLDCGSNVTSSKATTSKTQTNEDANKYPPCHPGCFPAGTQVATPTGPRLIETIRSGDLVTVVSAEGTATSARVDSTFQTDNPLVQLQTEAGSLLTTETQPLCLRDGGFRTAGKLVEGDQIWRWKDGKRHAVRVVAVVPTSEEVTVFNLVVGEPSIFVANHYLARCKPPLDVRAVSSAEQ